MFNPQKVLVSWGSLEVEAASCSACGLCTVACPSKALVAAGDDCLVIVFDRSLCDSCGKCIDACPEKAVKANTNHGQAQTGPGPVVLFRDRPARCRNCGAIIGSLAMISRVGSKLEAKDPKLAQRIQLCMSCRDRLKD